MTTQLTDTDVSRSSEPKVSVLITITTPGADTPICRLANSEAVIAGATVRQLIERVISTKSLFSVGVPLSQLEAESPTALAIGELLAASSCEVYSAHDRGAGKLVPLDDAARALAHEQVGSQGNRFLSLTLDVRAAQDAASPSGEERRRIPTPETVEAEELRPEPGPKDESAAHPEAPPPAEPQAAPAEPQPAPAEPAPAALRPPGAAGESIMTIVAEATKEEPAPEPKERKEYVRKSDWLRAQFLPEVQALDFSGLFVGNLGLGVREHRARRNVLMSDPSRVTDILLRANGYRRTGDNAKALICYQELVDMDPANADFRFLLGKTLLALDQRQEALEALQRAKELGHDGAEKELQALSHSGSGSRKPLGFLRFWKQ